MRDKRNGIREIRDTVLKTRSFLPLPSFLTLLLNLSCFTHQRPTVSLILARIIRSVWFDELKWFEEHLLQYDYITSKRKTSYLTKRLKNRKRLIALYASQKHLIPWKEIFEKTQEIPCILIWQLPKSLMKSEVLSWFSISKKSLQ